MYRPEGWKRKEITNNPLHCFAPQQCADSFFEAGADAMLEGLKKVGQYGIEGQHPSEDASFPFTKCADNADTWWEFDKTGHVLFIPEEE